MGHYRVYRSSNWEKWARASMSEIRPIVVQPEVSRYGSAWMRRTSTTPPRLLPPAYDRSTKRVRVVKHSIFQPSPDNPLDFEQTVERTLLDLCRSFYVRQVFYDPYQLVAVAQRLQKARVPMVEFPQSVGNLTEASSNLYDLIQGRNLTVYPDPALRLAISRAVGIESGRGWRITKEKASHKIDVVVALAQAALGAAKQEGRSKTTIRPLFGFSFASPVAAWRARGEARLREQREIPDFGRARRERQHSAVIEDSRAEYRAGRNSRHATRAARYRHLPLLSRPVGRRSPQALESLQRRERAA